MIRNKRSNFTSPNILFISWLTEWRDEAAGRESKMQYTYSKALRSLQKYPLLLSSGKECKLLEGFGDKLCNLIDEKIKKEIDGSNLTAPEYIINFNKRIRGSDDEDDADNDDNIKPKNKKTAKRLNREMGKDDADDGDLNSSLITKVRKISQSTDYQPAKHSGGYALILTLYDLAKNGTNSIGKRKLMELAQPLSEASFKIPNPSSRYTAWSSMGTLLKKGLVGRRGCPAVYYLTMAGHYLADRMINTDNIQNLSLYTNKNQYDVQPKRMISKAEIESDSIVNSVIEVLKSNAHDDIESNHQDQFLNFDTNIFAEDSTADSSSGKLSCPGDFTNILNKKNDLNSYNHGYHDNAYFYNGNLNVEKPSSDLAWFNYISDDGSSIYKKDDAAVLVDDDFGIGFLIKAKYENLLISSYNYKLDFTRICSEANFVFAYLHDLNAPNFITNPNNFIDERSSGLNASKVTLKPNNITEILIQNKSKVVKAGENICAEKNQITIGSSENTAPNKMHFPKKKKVPTATLR